MAWREVMRFSSCQGSSYLGPHPPGRNKAVCRCAVCSLSHRILFRSRHQLEGPTRNQEIQFGLTEGGVLVEGLGACEFCALATLLATSITPSNGTALIFIATSVRVPMGMSKPCGVREGTFASH